MLIRAISWKIGSFRRPVKQFYRVLRGKAHINQLAEQFMLPLCVALATLSTRQNGEVDVATGPVRVFNVIPMT